MLNELDCRTATLLRTRLEKKKKKKKMDYEISTSDMGRAGGWVDGIGGDGRLGGGGGGRVGRGKEGGVLRCVKNKQKDGGAAVLLASDRDGMW